MNTRIAVKPPTNIAVPFANFDFTIHPRTDGNVIQLGSATVHFWSTLTGNIEQFRALETTLTSTVRTLQNSAPDLSPAGLEKLKAKEIKSLIKPFNDARKATQSVMRDNEHNQRKLNEIPSGDTTLRVETRGFYLGLTMQQAITRLLGTASVDELDAVLERIELFNWTGDIVERIRERHRLLNVIRMNKITAPMLPSAERIAVVGEDQKRITAHAEAIMKNFSNMQDVAKSAERVLQGVVRIVAGIMNVNIDTAFGLLIED